MKLLQTLEAPRIGKILIGILIGFFIFNILLLDYFVIFRQTDIPSSLGSGEIAAELEEGKGASIIDSCYPYTCPDLIKQATASLSMESPTVVNTTVQTNTANEFFIPLGSGQTQSTAYENTGAQAYIDSTKYSNIQKVTFEASLRIPTANGTMYAQLYNVTDKHPVWFSEISTQSNVFNLQVSTPITLDQGNKLYVVQLMTTMGFQSLMDQARVHIITK